MCLPPPHSLVPPASGGLPALSPLAPPKKGERVSEAVGRALAEAHGCSDLKEKFVKDFAVLSYFDLNANTNAGEVQGTVYKPR
jgi:hypothetical protein